MCLFKIKVDEDEDDYAVARERRVYRRRSNADRIALASRRRVSVREPTATIVEQVDDYSVIPPPQPVPKLPGQKPLVVRPRTPPSPDVQFVHVSPHSSSSSDDSRGEYVYERREVRYERERSPERYHEYRYVDAPERREYPRERGHSRQRSRSRSRSRRRDDRHDEYDETKIRIRRREYD
jgi:hypothetical protein